MQLTCRMWVYSPLTLITAVRGKTTFLIKNTGLYQCMTFFPLVTIRCFTYNKHEVTMMHSSNHKEHYQKSYIILHTQNTTALQSNLFLTGLHCLLLTNKRTIGFVWRQQMPRSTANCSVNFTTGITFTYKATKPTYSFANFKYWDCYISKSFKYIMPLMMWPVWSLQHKITSNNVRDQW